MPSLTPTQQYAVLQIKALRKLTAETGTRTTFSQNKVLQALAPSDLTRVAVELELDQAGR